MKDHIVICGYTEITKCLIKDYFKSHIDNIIVIEKIIIRNLLMLM